MIATGRHNHILDVPGISIGHAVDKSIRTGVTVVCPDEPGVASVDVRGGGPGTRETDAMNADCLVEVVHAIVLSGGSAFGLDAASGVMAYLSQQKIGFEIAGAVVPIVPSAILFDLHNGGDKEWRNRSPYFDLGYQAVENSGTDLSLGNAGAGYGAQSGNLKGGLGSASFVFTDRSEQITVAAIAAVNSMGSVTMPNSALMWAAPYEQNNELGGQHHINPPETFELDYDFVLPPGKNTTLVVVATDAILTKAQARRIAIMAHDGFARAIRPVHTLFDGDTAFVISTGKKRLSDSEVAFSRLGTLAADCVTRSIARGIFEATSLDSVQSYRSCYNISR